MPRGVRKQVPSEEEVKQVLPNQPQAKQLPMQGMRRLQQARRMAGMQGMAMNNLMNMKARPSAYGSGRSIDM